MDEKTNPVEFLNEGGIPKNLLFQSKIDIEHLICPICLNILWKPVACAQDRCFQSFCDVCITKWISQEYQLQHLFTKQSDQQEPVFSNTLYSQSMLNNSSTTPQNRSSYSSSSSNSYQANETIDQEWIVIPKCPKCKRPFKKTSIPIIHNLLDAIQLNCIHEGCNEKPSYDQFQKHIILCSYRKLDCSGCSKVFLQSELQVHQKICELVLITCDKCNQIMMRKDLTEKHTKDLCIQQQFENKDHQIIILQSQIDQLIQKNQELEGKIEKMWKGDFEQIQVYHFKTSFTSNYIFNNGMNPNEVRLIRQKQYSIRSLFQEVHSIIKNKKMISCTFTSIIKSKHKVFLGCNGKSKLHLSKGICYQEFAQHYATIQLISLLTGKAKQKKKNGMKTNIDTCARFLNILIIIRRISPSAMVIHLIFSFCRFHKAQESEMRQNIWSVALKVQK